MKHVLVVAYHTPPAGGIPVRRVLRFLRHLPRRGLRCSLLTAQSPYDPYHPNDPEGVAAVDALPLERVLRTPSRSGVEKVAALGFRGLRTLSEWFSARGDAPSEAAPTDVGAGRVRRILGNTLFFPDPKRGWSRAALRAGLDLARDDPFDAIFATGYPWSALVLGSELAAATETPWVADLRDAWVDNPRGLFASARHRSLERRVLGSAAQIVTATRGIECALRERYGADLPPIETLYTGFDREETAALEAPVERFRQSKPSEQPERLVVTYTGTFNDALPPSALDQSPYALLRALTQLDAETRAGLELRLVGRLGERYRRWIASTEELSCVRVVGPVSHRRALAEQRSADVLLVVVGAAPANAGVLTGKFVEYVGAERPVWALAPPGELSDQVERMGGRTDPPDAVEAIAARLREWLELHRRGALPKPRQSDSWSAEARAERLATLLDDAIGTAPRASHPGRRA